MFSQVDKLKESSRIEFWVVTGLVILVFLVSVIDILFGFQWREANTAYSTLSFSNALIALLFSTTLVYVSYLFLAFYVSPEFKKSEKVSGNVIVVFLFIAFCFLIQIINLYLAALMAIKILIIYFNRNKENDDSSLYYESSLLFALWVLLTTFLSSVIQDVYMVLYENYVLPTAVVVYLVIMYKILPAIAKKKYRSLRYVGRVVLVSVFSSLIVSAVLAILDEGGFHFKRMSFGGLTARSTFGFDSGDIFAIALLNFVTQLLFVAPIASAVYKKRNKKRQEEIISLKTELGKSDASLNLLKSQINPHFLFNALNTLYGTALQENAERTGEGIQKLGDMMRFMLHENVHNKILLSRDVEYLKNYILLQKLRTSVSAEVRIQDEIQEQKGDLLIAPMLLIPFVENAFKHGISLVNPSHIKITLQVKEKSLYLDVYNSIHIKPLNHPEKGESGIGLDNVKQRLQLQYPGKHELIIRENANEFFVHLTIFLEETEK